MRFGTRASYHKVKRNFKKIIIHDLRMRIEEDRREGNDSYDKNDPVFNNICGLFCA